jgi:dipeptidyl aminopeptidase/acylaminoacyl peptidase
MLRTAIRLMALWMLSAGICVRAGSRLTDHPFDAHDLLSLQQISGPKVSPDGKTVVFVVGTVDFQENRRRTDLWVIGMDGLGLRRLTTHPANDFNPRWAPDGRGIWFLSGRTGVDQVWRIPVDGGEAEQIVDEPIDISSLVLSRDGKYIAYTLEIFPNAGGVEATVARLEATANNPASGRIYDRLFIRHWNEWKDGRRSHIFVKPAEGGAPVDVMGNMDADCPSKPFGGPEEYTFTPDGRSIVFTARDVGRNEAWSIDFDLYVVPIDGSARPRCITEQNEGWDMLPVFSPDGKTLVHLTTVRSGYEADRFQIALMSWPDGDTRIVAKDWDRSPRTLSWALDSRTMYTTADNIGQRSLFAVDTVTDQVRTLVREGHVEWPQVVNEGVVFGLNDLRTPTELHVLGLDGAESRQLTTFSDDRLARMSLGDPEQFSFDGWNGEQVYGYLVRPVDFDSSKSYPALLLIHGGPQSSWGNAFHYRWSPQIFAAAGYAVVMIDYHGSTGYGQAFTDSIRRDWGGKPVEDLRNGLAAALERYSWIDRERVAAAGWSFGGYLVNWIAGHWPDRFRCLINHAGGFDLRMFYFDTDELWFPEWDFGGTPWHNPLSFTRHSPSAHVDKWNTPMLVSHGARDYRVTETHAFSTFTALQRRGIPSKLLYFPDEAHIVRKPANAILLYETVLDWLNEWSSE